MLVPAVSVPSNALVLVIAVLRTAFSAPARLSLLMGASALALLAQQAPAAHVGTITIKFVGMANVSEQIVRAKLKMKFPTPDYRGLASAPEPGSAPKARPSVHSR